MHVFLLILKYIGMLILGVAIIVGSIQAFKKRAVGDSNIERRKYKKAQERRRKQENIHYPQLPLTPEQRKLTKIQDQMFAEAKGK